MAWLGFWTLQSAIEIILKKNLPEEGSVKYHIFSLRGPPGPIRAYFSHDFGWFLVEFKFSGMQVLQLI